MDSRAGSEGEKEVQRKNDRGGLWDVAIDFSSI